MRKARFKLAQRFVLFSCLSCTFVISGLLAQSLFADDTETFGKPSRSEKQVSRLVAQLMQRDHLSRKPLDNSISQRAFDMFVKMLDPMKVYFLQSDVDEFSKKWRDSVDDKMKDGDYEIAFAIFNRFLQRVDERTKLAESLVDTAFDYTMDEEITTDRDAISFAKNDAEVRDRWRKRIKYNLMVLKNDKDSKVDPKEKLKKRYDAYDKRMHQTDNGDVVEMYVTAITSSFDPHTAYMSKDSFENFLISMSLQLEGIGATLQSTDDGYTVIKRVVVGGAADKQGEIVVEDKIVGVGQGESGDFVDVTGMKLDDVVQKIRGKAGTTVRLQVLSEDGSDIKTVKIVREKIKLEDSAARGVVFEEGAKSDGSPYKIGVIDLPSFYADMESSKRGSTDARSTTRDVERILEGFSDKGVDSVVIDLRRNGGGSLREAIDCTGLFINTGTVVQVKDAYGQIQKHNDERSGMSWDGPVVVLTSKFSASASEILAGAIQDYGRGIVIGDTTTHGKGTVQSLIDLNQLVFGVAKSPNMYGALKITMQQFYRPNGDSTQKRGVLSDIVLPSITDKMDVSEKDLDYPVEWDSVPSAQPKNFGLVKPENLKSLQDGSMARIATSEKFVKKKDEISAYVEQKNRKTASLNEEKYLLRRKKLNAEKADKKEIEDQVNHSNLEIKRDYYMDEVLRITVDYLKLLGDNKVANN
ncbi:MAG: carboxy terminal-processing peptidase [Mariniblastus sp.]|nr:carboxy terminal-processing peptidase [Mariniblastus sp.]